MPRPTQPRLQAGSKQDSQTSAPERPGDPCLVLSAAGVSVTKEPVGLIRRDGKRPDGMIQISWRSGKLLVWDVTVVSTTAESYVADAVRGRVEVTEMAATRKCQKYAELSTAYL